MPRPSHSDEDFEDDEDWDGADTDDAGDNEDELDDDELDGDDEDGDDLDDLDDDDDDGEFGEFDDFDNGPQAPPPRLSEQLLLDTLAELPAGRLYCNTVGRAQFAATYAEQHADQSVTCLVLDLYQQQQAAFCVPEGQDNLQLLCSSDWPAEECDVAAVACRSRGEAELTRELLQQAFLRLKPRGRFIATIDRTKDQWLHAELGKLFPKVTRRQLPRGTVYLATKTTPLRRVISFDSEFAMRDGARLIKLKTRPGVFSHRRVDAGARALLANAEVKPGQRVLDLGCGTGVVGVAIGLRTTDVSVMAVDSNPRAIECTRWAAEKNGLTTLTAVLDCDGTNVPQGEFDLVLANPPYFSAYKIAELFLNTAAAALKPGGTLQLVTKTPDWFDEHMQARFNDCNVVPVKDYFVVVATNRETSPGKRKRRPD